MSGRLRVRVVIDSLRWGGAELLLSDLARVAPDSGIDLSVSYLSDGGDSVAARRLAGHGIEPERVQVAGLLSPASLRSMRRHLAARAPDLVHTQLEYADVLGGVAARSLGIPSVCTLHVMRWGSGSRDRARARLAAFARRRCAYRVIAVSDAARRAYLAHGWDSDRHLVTIPNGTAAAAEPGAGAAVRAGLGIEGDELVVGMLTVLRPGKGHELAAAAVRALLPRFGRLRLLVAGDGPARAQVAELLRPLGDRATMTGHRDDVMALLDACDVLVHPSSVDAFPTALIEAMAASVPVIATRVGGIPEIVLDGETGLLIDAPPREAQLSGALAELLADPARRRAMGQSARARYDAQLTADRWVQRLSGLYRAAVGS